LFFTGGLGVASAQIQDGLVNVAVGGVTIREDVNVGVAAQVAANVCGVNVSDVNVLATQVDLAGNPVTVCQNDNRPVTISQN
jgi:xanthine dehydrogenase molybdopterin-binding subunit B